MGSPKIFKTEALWIWTFNRTFEYAHPTVPTVECQEKSFPWEIGHLKRPEICNRKRANFAQKNTKKADQSVLHQEGSFFPTFSVKTDGSRMDLQKSRLNLQIHAVDEEISRMSLRFPCLNPLRLSGNIRNQSSRIGKNFSIGAPIRAKTEFRRLKMGKNSTLHPPEWSDI